MLRCFALRDLLKRQMITARSTLEPEMVTYGSPFPSLFVNPTAQPQSQRVAQGQNNQW